MADSKITDLISYDTGSTSKDDVIVIVDIADDQTCKLTLGELYYLFEENALELSDLKLVQLTHNRSCAAGVSWIVNPSVHIPGYLPGVFTNIVPTPLMSTNFASPVKIKFKPYQCCKDLWPSLPHVVLRPGTSPVVSEYKGAMTIRYCGNVIATVTFSKEYLGEPFIFVDETGLEIMHFNTGERLRFKEGIVQLQH
jgi:hypothetical protein